MGKLLGDVDLGAAQWTPGAAAIAVPTKSVLTISFDRSLLRVLVKA